MIENRYSIAKDKIIRWQSAAAVSGVVFIEVIDIHAFTRAAIVDLVVGIAHSDNIIDC